MSQIDPTADLLSKFDRYVPAAAAVVAVLLVTVALVIGFCVLLSGREKGPCVRQAGSWLISLIWALPVVAVLAYLCVQAAPRFHGAMESVAAPIRKRQPANQIDLGEPAPFDGGVDASPAETSPPADASTDPKASAEDSPPPPTWIGEPSKKDGQVTLLVVKGAPKLTAELAEADALAVAAAKLKEDFHQLYPDRVAWRLPDNAVADAVRKRYLEPFTTDLGIGKRTQMYVVHLQVELSPDVRQSLFPYWREPIVQQRLWMLGGLVGLLTLITGTLAVYFRLDTLTRGAYRNRLKLAAVSLIVSGGLLLATIG